MRVGDMYEAQKFDDTLTHSLCIARLNENEDFEVILSSSSCQQRLLYWGNDILVAVSKDILSL